MSCDLTMGRAEVCKNSQGGVKAMYLINFDDVTGYTPNATDTDMIDAILGGGTINAYKYELKGANNLEQTLTSSRDAGTSFTEATLTAVLKKQDASTTKELKLLSWGRPRVIIEDRNSNYFLMGKEYGCELETLAITTGTALADMSGYTITLKSMEAEPCNFVNASNDSDLENNVGLTIVAS